MMMCKQYIFLLTSGQLTEASVGLKLQTQLHRLHCRHCRAFTHNDQALQKVLDAVRERAQHGPDPK